MGLFSIIRFNIKFPQNLRKSIKVVWLRQAKRYFLISQREDMLKFCVSYAYILTNLSLFNYMLINVTLIKRVFHQKEALKKLRKMHFILLKRLFLLKTQTFIISSFLLFSLSAIHSSNSPALYKGGGMTSSNLTIRVGMKYFCRKRGVGLKGGIV